MNWYKQAQFASIAITSCDQTWNELGISFNGGPAYTYPDVSPHLYEKIRKLLYRKNYSEVGKILNRLSKNTQQKDEPKEPQFNFMQGN